MDAIVLSSGDKIFLRSFCSRKLWKKIQGVMLEKVEFDSTGKPVGNVPGNKMEEANDIAVLGMIQKAEMKDGASFEVDQDYLDNLPQADFKIIHNKVQEITKAAVPNA